MTSNPLFRRQESAQPFLPAYGSAEYLAQTNIRCTRDELEWFYDQGGNMRLRYKHKRFAGELA